MQPIKRAALIFFLAVLSAGVGAHPHSFIYLQTQPVSENDSLVALQMRWAMDELTSADLLYDAGDAQPGSAVWKRLATEVMANVLAQHYFTELWRGDKPVALQKRPTTYSLTREGHQAVLTFVLPLAEPQPLGGESYTFSTFDPSYYVDMSYAEEKDASLPQNLEGRCRIVVETPTPGEEMLSFAQSLDRADAPPEDMNLGKQFAQKVTLQCR
ncbi:DUF1007 family protein [Intestinirhabdus alba]|jgi:ABC-type uncharacterized transport system substrate-binding protein|uniref:DUF1007 family protein n=1 Tax=Intestinirhabdus alba TaxID=2899544 RepID=A0A6L6IIS6_9ENTR|nr:DUF1007 family protein [Intestinirhabdus alba]MTH45844.1 DUF1007 family protein [Intestinirhabdus alba]